MKVCKVLFISLPTFSTEEYDYEHAKRRGIPLYPPIALATLASSVHSLFSKETEIRIFDYDYEIIRGLLASEGKIERLDMLLAPLLEEFRPDIVGLSYNFGLSTHHVVDIVHRIKIFSKDIVVFAGGNHATLYHDEIMRHVPEIDYILRYEADYTIVDFFNFLEERKAFEDVQGLCRKSGGAIECTGYSRYPADLDSLPAPEWQLTDIGTYHTFGRIGSVFNYGDPDLPTYTVYTTRGCGGNCKFCTSKAFNGAKVRYRGAESILHEIDDAYHRFGIRQFEILDDDFTFSRKRALDFSRQLAARGYDLKWNLLNGIRLVTLDDELVESMIASGLRLISVGIESCHPDIMRKIRKQLNPDILHEKMTLLNRYPELYVKGNFIFGFPYETWEHIQETARVARELVLYWYIFSIFTPLPNTPLFKEVESAIPDFSKKYMLNRFKLDVYDIADSKHENYDYLKDLIGISMDEMSAFIGMLNLQLNFVENKNLQGRDVGRAIRDFEGILKFIKPDHAVAHACLQAGYSRLGDAPRARQHGDTFRTIIDRDVSWRAKALSLGLVLEDGR